MRGVSMRGVSIKDVTSSKAETALNRASDLMVRQRTGCDGSVQAAKSLQDHPRASVFARETLQEASKKPTRKIGSAPGALTASFFLAGGPPPWEKQRRKAEPSEASPRGLFLRHEAVDEEQKQEKALTLRGPFLVSGTRISCAKKRTRGRAKRAPESLEQMPRNEENPEPSLTEGFRVFEVSCAKKRTRTSTGVTPLAPQASASAIPPPSPGRLAGFPRFPKNSGARGGEPFQCVDRRGRES